MRLYLYQAIFIHLFIINIFSANNVHIKKYYRNFILGLDGFLKKCYVIFTYWEFVSLFSLFSVNKMILFYMTLTKIWNMVNLQCYNKDLNICQRISAMVNFLFTFRHDVNKYRIKLIHLFIKSFWLTIDCKSKVSDCEAWRTRAVNSRP